VVTKLRKNNVALEVLFMVMVLILSTPAIKVSGQKIAPDFTLTDIDGNEFTLSDQKGKVVLLEFLATWCSHCVKEIPTLKVVYEKFEEALIIISISVDPDQDTGPRLKQFREKYAIPWKIARDTVGVSDTYGVSGLPTTMIIDQEGYIRYRHVGEIGESALSKEVKELIKKPPVASFTYLPTNPVVGETVTFNASASHDPDGAIVSYKWDFGDATTGTGVTTTHAYTAANTYIITLTVTDNDNTSANTTAKVTVSSSTAPVHDVAITNVTASEATVTIGESVSITVMTKNEGTETETFDMTIYQGTTTIEKQTVTNLSPGASKSLTSKWDTVEVSPGTYTIRAVASAVPGENDTADNTFIDGKVTVQETPPPPPPPPSASDNFLYAVVGIVTVIVATIVVYLVRVWRRRT